MNPGARYQVIWNYRSESPKGIGALQIRLMQAKDETWPAEGSCLEGAVKTARVPFCALPSESVYSHPLPVP